ncbi:hypothetical protein IHN63_05800 [Deinococcus sp. 6YEL10]|uniref:hypothetical protein n=1 Tax=Deinococcus sp. 6YEL10 TaxID=2745870 RepID=UPI001E4A82A9|nr:hypothetical protein [Deinococcus sp. 6YEL10]MCD0160821.1 hypothetical protein [Deinococcus sp. 6YEL10]
MFAAFNASGARFSELSMLLYLFAYFPFIFSLRPSVEMARSAVKVFINFNVIVSAACSVLLMLNIFGLQVLDPLGNFLRNFQLDGYNIQYPIFYGSQIFKQNGIFYLEPSFFSQFIAIALAIEIKYRRKVLYIIILLFGFISSFSGTGIIIIGAFFLSEMLSIRKKLKERLWIIALVLIIILVSFVNPFYNIFERLSEITTLSENDSSGFYRFISPFINYSYFTSESSILTIMIGCGAGCVDRLSLPLIANYNTIFKLLFEYGLIGLIVHYFLILSFIKSHIGRISSIYIALLVFYCICGGYLLSLHVTSVIFILLINLSAIEREAQ